MEEGQGGTWGGGSQGEERFPPSCGMGDPSCGMGDRFEGWGMDGKGRGQLWGKGSFFGQCQSGHEPAPEQQGRDGSGISEAEPHRVCDQLAAGRA